MSLSQFIFMAFAYVVVSTHSSPVDVHGSARYQPFLGSGAAFTGASTFLFMTRLNNASRSHLFRHLFGSYDSFGGAQFTAMRIVMGTCDFNLENYTYDDLPTGVTNDFNLTYFSIEKDLAYVIPAIKEALQVNPHIKIVASPWSAPAWMKVPQTLFGGNLSQSLAVREAYAKYFRSYVEAYKRLGIPIFAVTVQNEPRFETGSYPSMGLTPQDEVQMSLLIAAEFEASSIINGSTKVLVYDHNWDDPQYPIDILNNVQVNASETIIGSAFHCYAGDVSAQSVVHNAIPNKRIFFTECCGGAWAPNFGDNLVWDTQNLVIGAVHNWAETVTKWNMALDVADGPHLPSACTNCWGLLTVSSNGTIGFREDFYALAHLNMWLNANGDNIRVGVSNSTNTLAFRVNASTSSGAYVTLLLNPGNTSLPYVLRIHHEDVVCTAEIVAPPVSLITVRWILGAATAQWVLTTGDQAHLRQLQSPVSVVCTS